MKAVKAKAVAFMAAVRDKHPTLYQFLSFAALGGVVTVVDFAVFSLCRYLLYTSYLNTPFHFWLFDYGIETGGLCAFLSFVTSFVLAQIVSFLMQRNITFKAGCKADKPLRMLAQNFHIDSGLIIKTFRKADGG